MALPSPAINFVGRSLTKLQRAAVVPRAVAAPTRPVKSAVPELLDGRVKEQSVKFEEYTQATQMLKRLTGQTSDLALLLDQLNDLEASLDDKILAPPAPADEVATRQAKRAAKRAERKAQSTSVPVAESAAAVADIPTTASQPGKASVRGPSASTGRAPGSSSATSTSRKPNLQQQPQQPSLDVAVPDAPSSSLDGIGAATDVQQLEELFKITVCEPDLSRTSTGATASVSAGPILRPRKGTGRTLRPAAGAVAPAPAIPAPSAADALGPSQAARASGPIAAPAPSPSHTSAGRDLFNEEHAEAAASMLYLGPSDDELLALEREVAALGADEGEDDLLDVPGLRGSVAGARELEESAMVVRAPQQVSVSATGPSLLGLLPASAQPAGRGAQSRQARRSARSGGVARGRTASTKGESATLSRYTRDGTGQFLSQSSALVLTAEREREVTEVCKDFLFLEKVKRQCLKTLHRQPTQDELAAAVGMDTMSFSCRYEAGLHAKELLLKCNYRLVMTLCKGYMGKGMAVQDLVSEGVKGLLRGVELYDGSKGYRFGTYAHWWIRQAISRSMAETGRGVRLPNNMIEQLTRIRKASAELSTALNREPTVQELADTVKLSVARIEFLLEASRRNTSLDAAIGEDEGSTLKDSVQDERGAADDEFAEATLDADLHAVLRGLPAREAAVLALRFGLDDGKERTLEEVGERLGVTRERIRQMEAKALRLLQTRAGQAAGRLREYVGSLAMLDNKDLAARSSLGTKKT